uniref:C2H2-type domain-containing protein n=1 Tax=Cucumis sativus TaxID=3659 RepID=A0A0A0L7M5_CUCSA
MPTVWFSLKKSFPCKPEPSEVYDPKNRKQLNTITTKKASRKSGCSSGRSGCSRSIANLKDVIHGSKRHMEKPPICSPRSIGSSEFLNPIAHEVILSNSKCELKITGFGSFHQEDVGSAGFGGGGGGGGNSPFFGTLRPGTPGPGEHFVNNSNSPFNNTSMSGARKVPSLLSYRDGSAAGSTAKSKVSGEVHPSKRFSPLTELNGNTFSTVTCHKCGEQFCKLEAAESHHLSKHAVTELVEGDSSRKIVEIICRTNLLKSENNGNRIERVFKVHNMQKTLAGFEEYREMVKIKASKLSKKHPRCLADGNELLRFYGTTLACSLGLNGSSSLCISQKCSVCRIIRNGFSTKKDIKEEVGVFTTSTSGKAFETIKTTEESSVKKALIICRVIAGRVHRPLENIQDMVGQSGFDSLAGKVGLHSNIEELYLLNPRALLPCFVVICKP